MRVFVAPLLAFLDRRQDPNPNLGRSQGLGLAIVLRLIDQLQGRLEAESDPSRKAALEKSKPFLDSLPSLKSLISLAPSTPRATTRVAAWVSRSVRRTTRWSGAT